MTEKRTKIKIGIDEAGRGPWCGPVVACALAWNPNNMPQKDFIASMNDSKKLTEKKRGELYGKLVELSQPSIQFSTVKPHPNLLLKEKEQATSKIKKCSPPLLEDKGKKERSDYLEVEAMQRRFRGEVLGEDGTDYPQLFFGVGVVDNFFIDEQGIKKANREAMRRALVEIKRKIPKSFTEISVVVDGNDNYNFEELTQKPLYIVGGDGKVSEIGAASIIAKVFRDKLMTQYATLYPQLGFETNAGYGTKKHSENLKEKKDITGIHRTSYKPVKEVLEKKEKVLVHICCGPDATVPIMDLKEDYEVIAFWYDPNIQPKAEYDKRLEAFIEVCKIEGVEYIEGEYDVKNFFKRIKGLEDTPERGEKCTKCYDMRLERTAQLAREMGITKWTSSLNNSPHKDMEKMFALGEKWSEAQHNTSILNPFSCQEKGATNEVSSPLVGENGERCLEENNLSQKLDFLKIAFRKNGGFQRSVDYTKKHNIYRQNYCGCVYSDTFPGREKPGAKKGFSG